MKVYLTQDTAQIKATFYQNAVLHSPATSTKVTIWAPDSDGDVCHVTKDIDGVSMTESSTGVYTYNYDTTGKVVGIYAVSVVGIESTTAPVNIARQDGEFEIKAYPG